MKLTLSISCLSFYQMLSCAFGETLVDERRRRRVDVDENGVRVEEDRSRGDVVTASRNRKTFDRVGEIFRSGSGLVDQDF